MMGDHKYMIPTTKLHAEKLFKQPPPSPKSAQESPEIYHEMDDDECPICSLMLPTLGTGKRYMTCCGKTVCSGCIYAPRYDDQGNEVDNDKCPFCRSPTPDTNEEIVKRLNKRIDSGDSEAIERKGHMYRTGECGFQQDMDKALEHWHRAVELGHAQSYYDIGVCYCLGQGVRVDKKKARYYLEQAAKRGCARANYELGLELGIVEESDIDEVLHHHMIAVRSGVGDSLDVIRDFYSNRVVDKDDYLKALQSYSMFLVEIKSYQRDRAATNSDERRYY